MPRIDYDQIKNRFGEFVDTLDSKRVDLLDNMVTNDAEVRINVALNSNDEYDHLEGIKRFVNNYPKTDVIKLNIYNYACNLVNNNAQQCAHVICESLNFVEGKEELDVFYYSIHCATHWTKIKDVWMMDQIHMDVYPFYGNLREYFEKTWYFGSKLVVDGKDGRVPAIEGEYDLPWEKYPDCEDVLTENEKIKNVFARMYCSADYLVNYNRVITRSHKLCTNSLVYGYDEEVRNMVNSLRYKRLRDRYWCHPYKFESIKINDEKNYAIVVAYRVYGWMQRNHEYVWTRSNINVEHTCMAGFTQFIKEDGVWKVAEHNLKLGLYEVGNYSSNHYGDCD